MLASYNHLVFLHTKRMKLEKALSKVLLSVKMAARKFNMYSVYFILVPLDF